jgi:hypothetical protein
MTDHDTALASLKAARKQWNEALILCSLYVAARADTDPTAADLNRTVERAFDVLLVENIAGRTHLAEHHPPSP